MRLLFITHKIKDDDDDFAFACHWVQEFVRQGFDVRVIAFEKWSCMHGIAVHSLGKERGYGAVRSLFLFWWYIMTVPHTRVFVHMNPKWVMAGALYWWACRTPVYLWYTHYTMHTPLRIAHWLCHRLFAATAESMPQYAGDQKKVIVGHGIDINFWNQAHGAAQHPVTDLIAVHRLSRSKRFDLALRALALLPHEYTLTHYGRPLEPEYDREIRALITELHLEDRVHLMGPVPMPALREIYPEYAVMVNMVPDTIDKTVLEGMVCGLYPVIEHGHAEAIGFPLSPRDDTPQAIAEYIQSIKLWSREELRSIVEKGHSIEKLVGKMGEYIRSGT